MSLPKPVEKLTDKQVVCNAGHKLKKKSATINFKGNKYCRRCWQHDRKETRELHLPLHFGGKGGF